MSGRPVGPWPCRLLDQASRPPAAPAVVVRDSPPVVSFEDVSKVYGNVRAVAGLSLDLRQGETVAFLGPNGAGVNPLTPRERDAHAASADGSLI